MSLFLSLEAYAADTEKRTEAPRPNSAPVSDVKGALKVEPTPAMTKEELEEGTKISPRLDIHHEARRPAAESGHLFGLHGSLGLPHPINFGLNYVHSSRVWSAEFSTGSFRQTISDAKIGIDNTEIALRWHPFAGSFFVGALYGQQKVTASMTDDIVSGMITYNVTATGEVKSNYVTPHLGWMWGHDDGGFFATFELGYQSPSNVKVSVTSDAPSAAQALPEYQELEDDAQSDAEKYGKMSLPYLALLKIGWLF